MNALLKGEKYVSLNTVKSWLQRAASKFLHSSYWLQFSLFSLRSFFSLKGAVNAEMVVV